MLFHIITSPITSLVLLVLGASFFQMFISIELSLKGVTETNIGAVHTCYYGGLLLAALLCDRTIHKIGHIRSFSLYASVLAVTILVQSLTSNIFAWMVVRLIAGFAVGGLFVVIESWLLAESTENTRGKKLAIYMIGLYCAQTVGPHIQHLIELKTSQPYIVSAIFCCIACVPVALTRHATPVISEFQPVPIKEVFVAHKFGFLGCIMSGIIISSLTSLVPTYALQLGIEVPTMMSLLVLGGFLLQWPLGKMSDILDRRKMILALFILSIFPSIMLFYSSYIYLVFVLIFVLGGLSYVIYPVCIAAVCDKVEAKYIIQATGILLFAYSLGSIFGPLTSAAVIDFFNDPAWLFMYVGIIAVLASLLGFAITEQQLTKEFVETHEIIEDSPVEYVPIPTASTVSHHLDPRAEEPDEE